MSSSQNAGHISIGDGSSFLSEGAQEDVLVVSIPKRFERTGLISMLSTGDFALNEISYVVVFLLQRCDDIQLMNDTGRVSNDATVINKPGNGVHVRLHHSQRM